MTGLVQEFEFGMNWSNYSRFVGNVFGGPLAMEGLVAFFVESTFLGLWIFGWDRLSKKVHLTCIWLVAGASMLSALFIMAANSWMQHPVGLRHERPAPARSSTTSGPCSPIRSSCGPTRTSCWPRWSPASIIMLAVSAWHLRRKNAVVAFRRTAIISLVVLAPAVFVNMFIGSELGVVEGKYQPMKIAAAEALWTTCPSHCPFSLFQIGGGNNDETPTQIIEVPDLLSILATNHVDGEVQGLNNLQAQYEQAVRAGQLRPQRLHPVLGHAGDGLPGRADRCCSRLWGLWLLGARRSRRPGGSSWSLPGSSSCRSS